MPIQQTTKRLVRNHYKKIIAKDCEMVVVIKKEIIEHRGEQSALYAGEGEAYWLWRGCQLLRPVFDISRERKAYEIRKYMTTIAKISAAQSREYLYKQELMKLHNGVLPEDIVCLIAQYTWDIMLLLK
tara:strand:+ start:345 stop:728 length:384 start_codon:yes stop_codon:yes gene_type:complete